MSRPVTWKPGPVDGSPYVPWPPDLAPGERYAVEHSESGTVTLWVGRDGARHVAVELHATLDATSDELRAAVPRLTYWRDRLREVTPRRVPWSTRRLEQVKAWRSWADTARHENLLVALTSPAGLEAAMMARGFSLEQAAEWREAHAKAHAALAPLLAGEAPTEAQRNALRDFCERGPVDAQRCRDLLPRATRAPRGRRPSTPGTK